MRRLSIYCLFYQEHIVVTSSMIGKKVCFPPSRLPIRHRSPNSRENVPTQTNLAFWCCDSRRGPQPCFHCHASFRNRLAAPLLTKTEQVAFAWTFDQYQQPSQGLPDHDCLTLHVEYDDESSAHLYHKDRKKANTHPQSIAGEVFA
jgi:hypothetical protein